MESTVLTRKQMYELEATGTTSAFTDTSPRRKYYRKPDGVLHPIRLPTDEDMQRVYWKKGWVPVSDKIAVPEIEMMVQAKIDSKATRTVQVDGHVHRFYKKLGSPCKQSGCPETRTKPYAKRSKN